MALAPSVLRKTPTPWSGSISSLPLSACPSLFSSTNVKAVFSFVLLRALLLPRLCSPTSRLGLVNVVSGRFGCPLGCCVAFFGPSLFTTDGRKFWKGLWKLLKVVWPPAKKLFEDCGKDFGRALSECCLAVCCCCCPKRQKAVVDDAKNNLNGSRSSTDPSTTATSVPDDTPTGTTTNSGSFPLLVRGSSQEQEDSTVSRTVSPAVLPSMSSRIPTISFGRRHPIPQETVRPLGTNLGQAFSRHGKALTQDTEEEAAGKDLLKLYKKLAIL
ncbi:hypothetical protein BKA56DRAFT_672451 [Ilyonectria sp. MPI-CAGE-AT-0026]|nr:hypothetical protein BKA56DRAFT_672451 [Ilyonectria sp. MPI-CAGE-AT-0026]